MSISPSVPIERVLAKLDPSLRASEAEAVLEVSYLAVAADRTLRDEEIAAFAMLARHVRALVGPELEAYRGAPCTGKACVSEQDIAALLDRCSKSLEQEGTAQRLASLAMCLSRPAARDFAYQMAYLMALADLDTNEPEARFDRKLKRVLGLTDDWAEALADEMLGVLDGGGLRRR